MTKVPTLLITGSVGVGKTTAAFECMEVLEERKIPHAFFDLDGLTYFYPQPPGDLHFGSRVALQGLGLVWPLMSEHGADRLILARVLESRDDLSHYCEAVPAAEITVVRLTAPLGEIEERLRRRELGAGLRWHLDRALELDAHWRQHPVEDFCVDTSSKSVRDIALEILERAQW